MPNDVDNFDEQVDRLIDALVSSLDTGLPTGVFRQVTDDTLLRTTGQLERLARALDARRVEAVGEIGHRSRPTLGTASLAVRKGCRDAVELVRRVSLASTWTVRRRVKLGAETRIQEALSGDLFPPRFPHIAQALQSGLLGVDAAAAIVTELSPTLVRADAAAVQVAEAELVAAATGTSPECPVPCTTEDIREQASVWRVFLDQDGTAPTEERAMTRRAFSAGSYNSIDGLVHGKYALMPEIHARLGRVFDACLTPKTAPAFLPATEDDAPQEPSGPAEPRSADQQRHDIFAAMVDSFARSGEAPTIGGASPTVLVTVSAETLETGHGAGFVSLGGLDGETVPISFRTVQQMICTGGTQTVKLDQGGAIVRLGSEQRCFTPAQRKAITVRDGGCIIPGCAIPGACCEIHHVIADTDGGPTHTSNGVLLCWLCRYRHNRHYAEVRIMPMSLSLR